MRGRIGAYTRWANTEDRYMVTRPAREGFYAKFEREVDSDGTLRPHERAKRAEFARRLAHNPEVAGSNPVPATSGNGPRRILRGPFSCRMDTCLDAE